MGSYPDRLMQIQDQIVVIIKRWDAKNLCVQNANIVMPTKRRGMHHPANLFPGHLKMHLVVDDIVSITYSYQHYLAYSVQAARRYLGQLCREFPQAIARF